MATDPHDVAAFSEDDEDYGTNGDYEDDDKEEPPVRDNEDLPPPSSSGMASALAMYPMDFFTILGTVPKETEALAARWQYCKGSNSTHDTSPFQLEAVKAEMHSVRRSLYDYAVNVYLLHVKAAAFEFKLPPAADHLRICTEKDLKKAILLLEQKSDNEILLYKIFHQRFRCDKYWTARIVDEWARSNAIHIFPVGTTQTTVQKKPGARNRNQLRSRLGFGAICMEARKKVVKQYMRPLFDKKGWRITSVKEKKETMGTVQTPRTFTGVDGIQYEFHVVELIKPASNDIVEQQTLSSADKSGTLPTSAAVALSARFKATTGKEISADEIKLIWAAGNDPNVMQEPLLPAFESGANFEEVHPEFDAMSTPPTPEQQTVVYAETFLRLKSPEKVTGRTMIVAMESFPTPDVQETIPPSALGHNFNKEASNDIAPSTANTRRPTHEKVNCSCCCAARCVLCCVVIRKAAVAFLCY